MRCKETAVFLSLSVSLKCRRSRRCSRNYCKGWNWFGFHSDVIKEGNLFSVIRTTSPCQYCHRGCLFGKDCFLFEFKGFKLLILHWKPLKTRSVVMWQIFVIFLLPTNCYCLGFGSHLFVFVDRFKKKSPWIEMFGLVWEGNFLFHCVSVMLWLVLLLREHNDFWRGFVSSCINIYECMCGRKRCIVGGKLRVWLGCPWTSRITVPGTHIQS